jgi:hypothetical protein
MAFTPTSFLSPDPVVLQRDQRHASRLFVDDQFRLAPKHKFLFHVAFSINPAACKNINLTQRHRNEIGMLVKSIDLPGFEVTVETANQYNRKKKIQTTHKAKDISVTFHDDNMGLINQLWQNYYSYYYADPKSAGNGGAYARNAIKSFSSVVAPYGLDNGSSLPFFNYIMVYQMARHEYVSYKLINPIITSWSHNKVDYAQNAVHDNSMGLAYEAVEYGSGVVTANDPIGFGNEHYDTTPSPLSGGASTRTNPSFLDTATSATNAVEYLNNASTSVNTYQNSKTKILAGSEGLTATVSAVQQGVSGLQGITFPVSTSTAGITKATSINLGI